MKAFIVENLVHRSKPSTECKTASFLLEDEATPGLLFPPTLFGEEELGKARRFPLPLPRLLLPRCLAEVSVTSALIGARTTGLAMAPVFRFVG